MISASGVSVSFGPRRVLDMVDLDVDPGELVALVGENGAGKTTLVGCVTGLLTPSSGRMRVCGREPAAALRSGEMAVVWQDLGLCDNLSITANLFLGRERGRAFLARDRMHAEAMAVMERFGLDVGDTCRRCGELSGGERQAVAIARALMGRPRVLVLDEPMSALGLGETRRVERLLRSLRSDGVAVLFVSHRVEQVFDLADRAVVLRQGRLVADLSTVEAHVDDVVTLMSGLKVDSVARRHLARLASLVDQLAEVEPSASIPMIVSALSTAVGQQQLCVHLQDDSQPGSLLLGASVGIASEARVRLARVPIGPQGGCIGQAAGSGVPVVIEDVRGAGRLIYWPEGTASMWSVPIIGKNETFGVLSGLADVSGRPQDDLLALASVYASLAATAIERERLLRDLTRRNSILEALRDMLDVLAGPEQVHAGLGVAVDTLRRGLRADATGLLRTDPVTDEPQDGSDESPDVIALSGSVGRTRLVTAAEQAAMDTGWRQGLRRPDNHTVAVPLLVDGRRLLLAAWWQDGSAITPDALDLIGNAARSLQVAAEREIAQAGQSEAVALRRTGDLQREFIHRLSHELRTPLTAITGYASTLRQTDVTWDEESRKRFLDAIATESARMVRLVTDLLDSSAISAGVLPVNPDWCDVPTVLAAAAYAVCGHDGRIAIEAGLLPAIWADHDRLEQVLVNLLDNALCHGGKTAVLRAFVGNPPQHLVLEVADDGPGIAPEQRASIFEPYTRGATDSPGAGLGLSICRGLVEAHNGRIEVADVPVGATIRVMLPLVTVPTEEA